MKRPILSLASASLAAMILSGCGGSSSDPAPASAPTVSGQVVDGVVTGLGYQCGSTLGVTDSDGRFYCKRGQSVRFFLGDVTLGSVTAAADMVVTPAMLAGEGALNLATLLLALDEDGDPENGLQMPTDVDTWFDGQVIDFTNDTAFADEGLVDNLVEQIVGDSENDLPDSGTVLSHLRQSARDIASGLYRGSYSDSEAGLSNELALIINRSGSIIGEVWTSGDAGSQRITEGYEGEGGYPELTMAPLGGGGELFAPRIALELEAEVGPGGVGSVEGGILNAVAGTETWQADRDAAGALPMDADMVGAVTGGPYSLYLDIESNEEGGDSPILVRSLAEASIPPLAFGNLQVFSNGDLAVAIGDWHCDGMSQSDPDYSDCASFDNSYGVEISNGVVTATDAEAGRIHFVAMDNNILVEGYLQRPQVIVQPEPEPLFTRDQEAAPVEAEAGPGYATISGTWTVLSTGLSGPLSGGSMID